jgi:hypothetical protein
LGTGAQAGRIGSVLRRSPFGVRAFSLALLLCSTTAARADEPPAWLPRYDLDIVLDTPRRFVRVCEDVTWTNTAKEPLAEIVFNAHAAYRIPEKDAPLLAKMLEILRMSPREAMTDEGAALEMESTLVRACNGKRLVDRRRPQTPEEGIYVPFAFDHENQTELHIPLPEPVEPGQTVTVRLNFTVKVPPVKGRWGQWDGVTTLAQWLPVVAVHDGVSWQPAPFIPWHQPFYNEAGLYTVRVTLPCDQKLAASSAEKEVRDLGDGWRAIAFEPACLRDFALIASSKFSEKWAEADGIKVRCLYLPEHEFYAQVFCDAVCEAIPIYNRWFGRYPYPQFTIAEACFGWNGNECGGLVMIDDRMFRMPHMAKSYPAYLIQHELCHQWWYNVVGTNGYCETFMDEGPATYFSHRLVDKCIGANNAFLDFPEGLKWLPNIHREDFRNFGYLGARKRGDIYPTVQKLDKYEHLVNLTAYAYDRGSKIIGLIEERLGEAAFFEFMRHVYHKYQYRILLVKNFQEELETWTGQPWNEFFDYWVYGSGMCDWSVESVEIDGARCACGSAAHLVRRPGGGPHKVVVHLKQTAGFNEPTVLGIRLQGQSGYQIRVPIYPDVPVLQLDEPLSAIIQCSTSVNPRKEKECQATVRVELVLPCAPDQITVDPDHMLLDDCPTNNHWKPECRWRLTPLYTQLEETDVTNAYDRWNFIIGPWAFAASYNDPWFVRQAEAGIRAGVYRTQDFYGGVYLAYRNDDRNVVAGVDGLWDHIILPQGQIGFTIEQSLATLGPEDIRSSRGVAYARYVLLYGDSLYLQPFHYVEAFGLYQNRSLPDPRVTLPGADPFNERPALGGHYHLNLMTPYWDAEGGFALDTTYQYGLPIAGNMHTFQELYGQFAIVKSMPRLSKVLGTGPLVSWLEDTRFAFRIAGAAGLPLNGEFFSLGGGNEFRGFDPAQRQGSVVWVGSAEWRLPIMRDLDWDTCDHFMGVRNVFLAPFYDAGNAYLEGQPLGSVAHAVGVGLRLDMIFVGMIERATIRLDIAKTINAATPWQIWAGVGHAF